MSALKYSKKINIQFSKYFSLGLLWLSFEMFPVLKIIFSKIQLYPLNNLYIESLVEVTHKN